MNAVSPPNRVAVATELAYLPVFFNLRGRRVLLIGGGEAAAAKLDLLLRAGAAVSLVAARLDPILQRRVDQEPAVICSARLPVASDFVGPVLAIDASGDLETSRQAVELARRAGVPINVVDRPELCDFIMPSILDRSPVVVAVSTGGVAPAIAQQIRRRLETALPPGIGDLATLAARYRQAAKQRLASPGQRAAFWERFFNQGIARILGGGRLDPSCAFVERLLEQGEWEETGEEARRG